MRFRSKTKEMSVDVDEKVSSNTSNGGYRCPSSAVLEDYLNVVCKKSTAVMTETKSISDTVTPDFFRRQRDGEILPTNACTRETKVEYPAMSSMSQALDYDICDKDGNLSRWNNNPVVTSFLAKPPKALFKAREIDAARAEAAAKVRSMGMDALTSLVEGRQTLAMLVGAKRNLTKTVKDLIRTLVRSGRKPKTLGDLIDATSSPWLEARFGWRILYYDLLSIQDYLDKRDKEISLVVGRSRITKQETVEGAAGQSFLYEESVNFGFPGLLDYSIVGNSSIANTIWEVIPFSLVLDMFFDIQTRIIAHSGKPVNVRLLDQANFQTTKRSCLSIAQAPFRVSPEGRYPYRAVLHEPTAISAYQERYTRVHDRGIPSKWPTVSLSLGGYKPVDLFYLSKIIFDRVK